MPTEPTFDSHASAYASALSRLLQASLIPCATTLGVLAGFGRRHGGVWQPVNAAAHLLIGSRADNVLAPHFTVTLAGVAVVLSVSAAAVILVAGLVSPRRPLHTVSASFAVAFAGYLMHVHAAARTPGGLADILTIGELRAMYCAFAIALAAGTRFR